MQCLSYTAPLSSNPGISLGAPSDPPARLKPALKTLRPSDKTSLIQKIVFFIKTCLVRKMA